MSTMAASTSLHSTEKKPWWLSTKKVVDKHIKEAKLLISTRDPVDINSALSLLDSALSFSPSHEPALELKARCLLHLRHFKDVADMLQGYIPSYKFISESSDSDNSSAGSSVASSQPLTRDRVKLLRSCCDSLGFKCFSASNLKNRVLASLFKNPESEGHWRYIVLGQACCHLGLMEDAMALLQTGKRLASAAFRRKSNSQSEDTFASSALPLPTIVSEDGYQLHAPPLTESESINHLIAQIKLLLRRRAAAVAALDAGLFVESIRHFSKILDGRRPAPQAFLAECHLLRSSANRAAGRIAESIADVNKTLALDPSSVAALIARASLFELIGCLTDSVHDLEHAKLLLNSILRDRKAPGVPSWMTAGTGVRNREIPGRLCQVSAKIQRLKARLSAGETGSVDYHALIGIRRGGSRSELDRAHLLLVLKHKPDRSVGFLDRCEFGSGQDREDSHDRARMSAVLLYRLIQKGYSNVAVAISEEEKAEIKPRRVALALQQAQAQAQAQQEERKQIQGQEIGQVSGTRPGSGMNRVYQGGFCRDLAVVGSLLSQTGFNHALPVKYEALSC